MDSNNGITAADRRSAGGALQMKDLLESKRDALASVATGHLTPDKLLKIVGVAMSRTPKLLRCTPMSVLSAVMTMAELGLAPNTLGSAYLIPYDNNKKDGDGRWRTVTEAQLIVGYRGLVELARRSGDISTLHARVVREGDEFEVEFGLNEKLRHVPRAGTDAKIRFVYAIAHFKDGGHQFDIMDLEEVAAVRARSKASGKGPWVTDFAEMAKKTVIRRLCKLLPLTPEAEHAVAVADRTEFDFGRMGFSGEEGGDEEGARDVDHEPATAAKRRSAKKPEPVKAKPIRRPEPKPEPPVTGDDLPDFQEPTAAEVHAEEPEQPAEQLASPGQITAIKKAIDNGWITRDEILERYGCRAVEGLTFTQAREAAKLAGGRAS